MKVIMNLTEVDRVAAAWERKMLRDGYKILLRYPSYWVDDVWYYTLSKDDKISKFKITCWTDRMQFMEEDFHDDYHVPYRWDKMFSMC